MNDYRRSDERSGSSDSGMWSRTSAIVAGLLLITAGAALLAVNTFGMQLPFDLGRVGWPAFVIIPGLALLILGLVASGEPGVGLAVAGGIVTTIGLILAYQSATDHWSSWAYAWALIAPTSVGLSMFLWGLVHRRGSVIRQGISGIAVGIVLFTVGFAFFEGVLGIGGDRGLAPMGRQVLPVALIAAGALIIISRFWPRRRPGAHWTPPPATSPTAPPTLPAEAEESRPAP